MIYIVPVKERSWLAKVADKSGKRAGLPLASILRMKGEAQVSWIPGAAWRGTGLET